MAHKLRRAAIAALFEFMVCECEKAVKEKCSPSYLALLQGEMSQQAILYDESNVEEGQV